MKQEKEQLLSPAEILLKILRNAVDNDKEALPITDSKRSLGAGQKEKINFKTFEYGSGLTTEYKHDTFYDALEAFDKIYEEVIKYDLEFNSRQRKFDFLSLMNLIKDYL